MEADGTDVDAGSGERQGPRNKMQNKMGFSLFPALLLALLTLASVSCQQKSDEGLQDVLQKHEERQEELQRELQHQLQEDQQQQQQLQHRQEREVTSSPYSSSSTTAFTSPRSPAEGTKKKRVRLAGLFDLLGKDCGGGNEVGKKLGSPLSGDGATGEGEGESEKQSTNTFLSPGRQLAEAAGWVAGRLRQVADVDIGERNGLKFQLFSPYSSLTHPKDKTFSSPRSFQSIFLYRENGQTGKRKRKGGSERSQFSLSRKVSFSRETRAGEGRKGFGDVKRVDAAGGR